MTESLERDTVHPQRRTERTVLKVEVYDALAQRRGLLRIEDQAEHHRVKRQHWSAIRNGRKSPSAALAMRVADQFEVDANSIWRRERIAA